MYTRTGGVLEVYPSVNTIVRKGDLLARIKNIFGNIVDEIYSTHSGVGDWHQGVQKRVRVVNPLAGWEGPWLWQQQVVARVFCGIAFIQVLVWSNSRFWPKVPQKLERY